MTCLRSLDRDIRSFKVANLTHHNDVRVLSQKCFERDRKRQPRTVIDIDLIDTRQIDFRRVFCRGDIDARFVEQIEAGLQRHRLARTRGAGHQHHTVGAVNGVKQQRFLISFITQRINPQLGLTAIQNPHDDFFAE